MILENLFKEFIELNKMLGNSILEMSVKQHQVTLCFEDKMVYFPVLLNISKSIPNKNDSYVSTYNDNIYVTISGFNKDEEKIHLFSDFLNIIWKFAEEICTCPSLEYIISSQYMKCFLDKPGIRVEDLEAYENILESEGKAELEMHPQRPYLLFINENYDIE